MAKKFDFELWDRIWENIEKERLEKDPHYYDRLPEVVPSNPELRRC